MSVGSSGRIVRRIIVEGAIHRLRQSRLLLRPTAPETPMGSPCVNRVADTDRLSRSLVSHEQLAMCATALGTWLYREGILGYSIVSLPSPPETSSACVSPWTSIPSWYREAWTLHSPRHLKSPPEPLHRAFSGILRHDFFMLG